MAGEYWKSTDPLGGAGFSAEMVKRLKLVWLLLRDKQVPLWAKLILPLSFIYLISPVDFLPGMLFPVVGGLDDVGVLLLALALFVKLAPRERVEHYEYQLEYGDADGETINTTYHILDED